MGMIRKRNAVTRDLIVIAIVFVCLLVVTHRIDLFERMAGFAERYERFEVDDIFISIMLVAFSLAFFSFNRWSESRREIAERERVEKELRTANEELEESRRELQQANREIAQRSEENEMFVYSVSHDLRSPLVNLQGFSQELHVANQDLRALLEEDEVPAGIRRRGLELIEEDIAESLKFIRTGVTRLSGIIDSLLRLSRAGRVEYQWQEVDVEFVVGRVVDAMKTTIEERGAGIVVEELPPVWGDPTAVEQVFANLIGNAVNYLDPGRPGVIEVGCNGGERSGFNTYHVKDNGRGIPEQSRPKVFQVFQRLHPDTEGEGLGLTLVRRMVERHGGSIRVESVEGEGSTFFVELPESAEESSEVSVRPGELSRKA